MAAIELRSESGKWKYKTTTDDPLFYTLVGAMAEDIGVPDELVFPGTLGKAFDDSWKYVQLALEWMKYQKQINTISAVSAITQPPSAPKEVVYLHQLGVLAGSLDLPKGWEAFVAVDSTRTQLQARINHYKATLEWTRANVGVPWGDYAELVITIVMTATDHTVQPLPKTNNRGFYAPRTVISWLDPFLRYGWLVSVSNLGGSSLSYDVYEFLLGIDWETALKVIPDQEVYDEPHAKGIVNKYTNIKALAALMMGQGKLFTGKKDYIVPMAKTLGVGIVADDPYRRSSDEQAIVDIYKRLLPNYPDDADPSLLGLEPILGLSKVDAWGEAQNIGGHTSVPIKSRNGISSLVGWVNATVITYPTWYTTVIMTHTRGDQDHTNRFSYSESKRYDSKGTYRILTQDFPKLIIYLHSTLGLGVLARMVLSLLAYVEKGGHKIKKNTDPRYAKLYKDELDRALLRAVEFADLVNTYLAEHDGEDDSVKNFKLRDTAYVTEIHDLYEA